jgi:hypothetical protein
VANIRNQYQACLTAYAAVNTYNTKLAAYKTAKANYVKKWHTDKPVRTSKGKVRATPPTFTETQPTIPPDCPGPAATGGSTGSGGSS